MNPLWRNPIMTAPAPLKKLKLIIASCALAALSVAVVPSEARAQSQT